MGQGKAKAHDIGRWAHFNVKLHKFLDIKSLADEVKSVGKNHDPNVTTPNVHVSLMLRLGKQIPADQIHSLRIVHIHGVKIIKIRPP